jgi:hypothetical protein
MRSVHICTSTRGSNGAGGSRLLNAVSVPGDAGHDSGPIGISTDGDLHAVGKPFAGRGYLEK